MPFEDMFIASFWHTEVLIFLKGKWAKKINSVWEAALHVVSIACSWEKLCDYDSSSKTLKNFALIIAFGVTIKLVLMLTIWINLL